MIKRDASKKHAAHFEDEWLHTKKPIISKGSKDRRVLTDDLTAHWGVWKIRAKAGYMTDGASIPRVAWRVVGHPFEEYEPAAVIHDILYDSERFARPVADRCFLDLMQAIGIGLVRRSAIYFAVRLFGGPTWIKHTAASKAHAKQYLDVSHT